MDGRDHVARWSQVRSCLVYPVVYSGASRRGQPMREVTRADPRGDGPHGRARPLPRSRLSETGTVASCWYTATLTCSLPHSSSL
jgi:hypothetical protein